MPVNSTRRRVEMLLRNPRRRTSNLASLRRKTDAEAFSNELTGHSGVEWRTLGSVFSAGPTQKAEPSFQRVDRSVQRIDPSFQRMLESQQSNSSYQRKPVSQQTDPSYQRKLVSQSEASSLSPPAELINGIDRASLNRRDGD
jgi:hypothetical protein